MLTSELQWPSKTTVLMKRDGSYWRGSIAEPHMDFEVMGIDEVLALCEWWCDRHKTTPEYVDIDSERKQVLADRAIRSRTIEDEMLSTVDGDDGEDDG